MKQGFTLIEVLVAALIITLGAGGAFVLIQRTISLTSNAASQFEASYLAQEGMEIVRNIRDTNLLKVHKGAGGDWTDGLTGCEEGCEADYAQNSLAISQDRFLKFNAGLYSYTAGTDSLFKRTITTLPGSVDPPCVGDSDLLCVSVEVTWQERGRSHTVQAATELYNWLPPAP